MREVAFIKQNKDKWFEVEKIIVGELKKNPDDLSSLYIDLVNDLSYAQSYYPKSKSTVYLNYLVVQIYQKIYKTKRLEENRIKAYFTKEVPIIMYENRRTLLFTFCIFSLFAIIGVLSSIYDPEFAIKILGEGYVNDTLENIKKGNAVGVYQSGSNWGSAISIIKNNLEVGARMFLFGIFAGVGTLFALMQNSIMLGTFQYFFQEHGALGDSARGIWIHGAFEISAMIVEAMAGFMLGAAILFPKTFSRLESFKIGFKKAFKVYFSTIPFTIVAGIFEGFVTRYALTMPLALDLLIIVGTLGFIVYYYAVYPHRVYKKLEHHGIL